MAANVPEAEAVGSSWPLPPMQYIDLYTDEAVANGTAPPPPPTISTEPYTMFGCPFFPNESIVRSLESQKVRRLYPQTYDHKKELKRMNHSLLANFLDLLEILVKAPDSDKRVEKIEDIKLIFINMHHLINEYRQHQARETIRVMMHVQLKQRLEITERFEKQLEKVRESLQNYLTTMPDVKPVAVPKEEPVDEEDSNKEKTTSDSVKLDHSALATQLSTLDKMMSEMISDALDSQS